MERPKIMLTYISNIIDGPKRGKKMTAKWPQIWVFDYSRWYFISEMVLFMANPGTTNVWVLVWAKKYWQSTRRERLAASWTSKVKIINFGPLQSRYIKIVFFKPSGIEKNWLDPNPPLKPKNIIRFWIKMQEIAFFEIFKKKSFLGAVLSLKPLCWPQF